LGVSQKCTSCHAGTTHHKTMTWEPSCASCHREHGGAQRSLVRMPDAHCTSCHYDLSAHHKTNKPAFKNSITRFTADDHGAFNVPEPDPGRLVFNHKRHLDGGMVLTDDGKPFTFADIVDDKDRERYMKLHGAKDARAAVQMTCAACHV